MSEKRRNCKSCITTKKADFSNTSKGQQGTKGTARNHPGFNNLKYTVTILTENNQVLVRFTVSDTNQIRDRLAADNFQVCQGFSLAYFSIYRIQYIFPLKFVQIPKINRGFSG